MEYVKLLWKDASFSQPIYIYSELDDERWEVRKVEVYRDGRQGFADLQGQHIALGLSEKPYPRVSKIKDPYLEVSEVSKADFEAIWSEALAAQK